MAGWTAYLPDSPATLTRIENWLYIAAGIFVLVAALLPFLARDVGRHRAAVERRAGEKAYNDLETRYGELRKKTDAIEEESRPRSINDEQLTNLYMYIQSHPVRPQTITIQVMNGDGEATMYAGQLKTLLRYLHWSVNDNYLIAFGSQQGVTIATKPDAPQDVQDSGRGLADVHSRSGIPVAFEVTDKAATPLVLAVGLKPRKF